MDATSAGRRGLNSKGGRSADPNNARGGPSAASNSLRALCSLAPYRCQIVGRSATELRAGMFTTGVPPDRPPHGGKRASALPLERLRDSLASLATDQWPSFGVADERNTTQRSSGPTPKFRDQVQASRQRAATAHPEWRHLGAEAPSISEIGRTRSGSAGCSQAARFRLVGLSKADIFRATSRESRSEQGRSLRSWPCVQIAACR